MPNFNYPHQWAGIQFRERAPGSPRYQYGLEHSRAQTVYMTPWSDDGNFARDIIQAFTGFALVTTFAGTGVKYISRQIPMRMPSFDDFFYLDSIAVEGDVPTGQDARDVGKFDEAMLTVGFSVPDFFHFTDQEMLDAQGALGLPSAVPDESLLLRNIRVQWQPAAKWQTLPSMQALRFDNNTVGGKRPAVSTTQAVLLTEGELLVEWLGVPLAGIPTQAITNCVGKTNEFAFGGLNPVIGRIFGPLGVEPGTMICQMPRIKKPWRQSTGTLVTDIGYIFRVFPRGANSFYFWNATTGGGFNGPGFYPASRTGDGSDPLFTTANFSTLFRPE